MARAARGGTPAPDAPPGLRERHRRRRRHEIIESATALFRERGFDAVRVRDIAEHAAVSEGTIFNYFAASRREGVKELILDEVAEEQLDAFIAFLQLQIADADRSVFERAKETARLFAEVIVADRDLWELTTSHTSVWGAARTGVLREKQEKTIELVAELLAQGQARGEIRPELLPFMLAEAILAMLTNVATFWFRGYPADRDPPEELDLVKRVDTHMDLIIYACQVAPPPQRATRPRRPRA
jgi:TetR/AcrR family fatty acid metabolism transcriptional regulator